MNEEKIRIKELKANYKELKKLYNQTYKISENRSKEELKKRYKAAHRNIDAKISMFINSVNETPKYNESQDKKNLEKWGLASSIDEIKQMDSWAYGDLQFSSDKELKRQEKSLKKKLDASGRKPEEAMNIAQYYIFIRRKLHYRNEMNKIVGIDLQKVYIAYAPWEANAFNEAKEIYEHHQTKFEQLNEIQEGEYVLSNIVWGFEHDLRQNADKRNSKLSVATYCSVDSVTQEEYRESVKLHPLYHSHIYEEIDSPPIPKRSNRVHSYLSIRRSTDSGYESSMKSIEHEYANIGKQDSYTPSSDKPESTFLAKKNQVLLANYDKVPKRAVSITNMNKETQQSIDTAKKQAERKSKKQKTLRENKKYKTIRMEKEIWV